MIGYIKEPHTSILIGQIECGKTHLVLELIEKEYNKHFDYIVIICPTLQENSTYHAKEWIKNDGKGRGLHLWLLTQSYSAILKNLRRQAKAIFVWYPKEMGDIKIIHDELYKIIMMN